MTHASNKLQSKEIIQKNSHRQTSAHTRIPHALTGKDCKGTPGGVLLSDLLKLDSGYFKIWRKLKEHPIFLNDFPSLHVFLLFLTEAEWKEGRQSWLGNKIVTLKPGQLTIGRFQIMRSTGLSERKVRTALLHLSRKYEIVTIETTNRNSLITIRNWDKYQSETTNKTTTTRPAPDHTLSIKAFKNKKTLASPSKKRTAHFEGCSCPSCR